MSAVNDGSNEAGELRSPKDLEPALREEDAETRREKLKALLKLGKTRGFLTYSEIHSEFALKSDEGADFDSVVALFGDMGVSVYEQAPSPGAVLTNMPPTSIKSDDDSLGASVTSSTRVHEAPKSIPFKRVSASSFGSSGTDFLLNPSILSNIATGVNERKERERAELERALKIQEELRAQARKKIEELKRQKSQLWEEAKKEFQATLPEIYKAAFSGRSSVDLKVPTKLASRVVELLKEKGIKASLAEKSSNGRANLPDLESLYANIEELVQGFDKVDQELTSRHLSGRHSVSVNKDFYQLLDEAEDREEVDEKVELEDGITSEESIISDALADILSLIENARQASDGRASGSTLFLMSPEELAELYGHLRTLKMYLFSLERDLSFSDSASGVMHVRDSIRSTSSMTKKIENIEILLKKIEAPDHENYHVKVSWQARELNEFTVDESVSIVSWLITNGGQGLCRHLIQSIHERAGAGEYSVTFEVSHTGFHRGHWGSNGCMKVASDGQSLGIFPGTSEFLLQIFKYMGFKADLRYKEEIRELVISWG